MEGLSSCVFHMDNGCVERRSDGDSVPVLSRTAAENEAADHMHRRSELAHLLRRCMPASCSMAPRSRISGQLLT